MIYNQIPSENFKRIINGQFSASVLFERKYSFLNGKELVTEVPSLIKVKNNQITHIYPYGKKGFELNYPKEMPSVSKLTNGIVKYNDFNTLKTVTVLLLEPYISKNPKQYRVKKEGTGFLKLYARRKKDEGKTIWIQERNEQGSIIREISTKLIYAKNKDACEEMDIKKIPVNTGNKIFYYGIPVKTKYGVYSLNAKTYKSDRKPLENGEERIVKIRKYRD